MNNSKISVGLDIGTTKIVAMVGEIKMNLDKVEILGYWKIQKSRSSSEEWSTTSPKPFNPYSKQIEEAKVVSGQEIDEVVVGIAGQHIRSLQHSDYITRTDAQEVIIGQEDVELSYSTGLQAGHAAW